MKKLITVFAFCIAFYGHVSAQYCEFIQEQKLPWDQGAYFWGGDFTADGRLIHFGHSYFAHYVMDTNMVLVDSVIGNDVTGCYSRLTRDGKYLVTTAGRMMNEIDTAIIKNLDNGSTTLVTAKASSHFITSLSSDKMIYGIWGDYQYIDLNTGESEPIKKDFSNSGMKDFWPRGRFINNDQELVITHKTGVQVLSTKKWKVSQNLETGKDFTNLYLTHDLKHYYYTQHGEIFIRNSESHELQYRLKAKSSFIKSVKVASDLTFLLYIDRSNHVYYHDLSSQKTTRIVKSTNYSECTGLLLSPGGKTFYVGINANRWVKFKLYHSGTATNIDQLIVDFEYPEEFAKASEEYQLQLEYALKQKGYDVLLDNMSNEADEGLYELFCKEHGFENIKTDEAREFLGLPPLD